MGNQSGRELIVGMIINVLAEKRFFKQVSASVGYYILFCLHVLGMRDNLGDAAITDFPEYLLVLNTCPDSETAGRIAADLVAGKLAACVQVLPGLQSYFHWKGKVDCEDEYLLLIKTSSASYPALEQRIRELHPYELPEIIGVPVSKGLPEYLSWVDECTSENN